MPPCPYERPAGHFGFAAAYLPPEPVLCKSIPMRAPVPAHAHLLPDCFCGSSALFLLECSGAVNLPTQHREPSAEALHPGACGNRLLAKKPQPKNTLKGTPNLKSAKRKKTKQANEERIIVAVWRLTLFSSRGFLAAALSSGASALQRSLSRCMPACEPVLCKSLSYRAPVLRSARMPLWVLAFVLFARSASMDALVAERSGRGGAAAQRVWEQVLEKGTRTKEQAPRQARPARAQSK